MHSNFALAQLADPAVSESQEILRHCVGCGLCTATCPTYVLLNDEADSPRGRNKIIRDMLTAAQEDPSKAPDPETVLHIDRCLSCLSCVTTCPSDVDFMHLIDHARVHVAQHYERPPAEQRLRKMIAHWLPDPVRFRWALRAAALARPFARWLPAGMGQMVASAPGRLPKAVRLPEKSAPLGRPRLRVALLTGCVQSVLAPQINQATIRLLTRHGCEVVIAPDGGCCGALTYHLGDIDAARAQAKANVSAWSKLAGDSSLDAVVINASGCGTMVKDYGHLLQEDPRWGDKAAGIAAKARDISEVMVEIGLDRQGNPPPDMANLTVAYQAACSLQHGQQIRRAPVELLHAAGFTVKQPGESHLCCGSAGSYHILQPELAGQLRERKLRHLKHTGADVVASGNIGCMAYLGAALDRPIVHTVELLDWATGGPKPPALETRSSGKARAATRGAGS